MLSLSLSSKTSAQGFQKIVDINIDSKGISSSLPYNQNILFKLKGKGVDLTKVNAVMILEHRGHMNIVESISSYKNEDRLQRKYYGLDKAYNDKDSALEVYLREIPGYDSSNVPPYVLFPSRNYSLILYSGRELTSQEERLTGLIRLYVDDSLAGRPSASTWRKSANQLYDSIKQKALKETGSITGAFVNFSNVVTQYQNELRPFDTDLELAKNNWNRFMSSYKPPISYGGVPSLDILRKLSRDTTNTCLKKMTCEAPSCRVHESMRALTKITDSLYFDHLLTGKQTLLDLENIFFTPPASITEKSRLANLDSSKKQILAVAYLIQNILLDNSKISSTGQLYQQYTDCFPGLSYAYLDSLKTSLTTLDTQIDHSRRLLQEVLRIQKQRADYLATSDLFEKASPFSADTYIYSFETRSNYSIIPVFGYLNYGFQDGFNSFAPYTGVNFGVMHLDEEVPFRLLRKKRLLQRLVFTTGITLSTLKEAGKRDDLFANSSSLLTGVGFKLSHVVVVNTGTLWFRKEDPNPFITKKKVTATPFASIALNLKLKKLFEGFTSLVPLK